MATEQQRLSQILSKDVLSEQEKRWLLNYLEGKDTQLLQVMLTQQFGEDLKTGALIPRSVSDTLWLEIIKKARGDAQAGISEASDSTSLKDANLPVASKPIGAQPIPIKPAKQASLSKRQVWWAAASVVLFIAGAYFLRNMEHNKPAPGITGSSKINPGREGAILTLADGSRVQLDTVQNAIIHLEGGGTAKVVDGALVYEGESGTPSYNTMTTPKGRQFHLTLPDGTGVWLNSASSIRFPTAFSTGERKVEITGEAYFEVAASASKPFKVQVNQQASITVLGTHFNINAYTNEAHIAATLLEGSIEISNSSDAIRLRPGQQGQITNSSREVGKDIKVVNDVHIENVVAWKNGLFHFEHASLAEIMRQLERWYDIEVVYETSVPRIALKGEITRDVPLDQLLTALKKMGVHYKLEGRQLTIQQ